MTDDTQDTRALARAALEAAIKAGTLREAWHEGRRPITPYTQAAREAIEAERALIAAHNTTPRFDLARRRF